MTDGSGEAEVLQMRVYPGSPGSATLVYLPGLHGDWTLVGGFRQALAQRARFVEFTYPRTLSWSLEDYAAAIETALQGAGIQEAWLLGESYGSQLVWPLLARNRLRWQGAILAGGFVRHPARWAVRLARRIGGDIPLSLITRVLFGYGKIARWRYRHNPAVLAALSEFIARRTELDRQAAVHRLALICQNDPRKIAGAVTTPLYAITGLFDPVVPWWWVRQWLRGNCSALKAYRVIPSADHNVLSTGAHKAADQIVAWIEGLPDRSS